MALPEQQQDELMPSYYERLKLQGKLVLKLIGSFIIIVLVFFVIIPTLYYIVYYLFQSLNYY